MTTEAVGGCLGSLSIIALGAWVLMLALGAFHHDVSASVPALGYWIVLVGLLAARIVINLFRRLG